MSTTIIKGDSLERLKKLPENSIDALVTDPPYGLGKEPVASEVLIDWVRQGYHEVKSKKGFMGAEWDSFVPQPNLWKEAFRVMKPGAYGLVFAGSRTVDWMGMSLRLAGFEVRDELAYLYGSGMPHGDNVKPAHEPILLVRKPISEKSVKANVEKWGTGHLNIEDCRIELVEGDSGYVINTFDDGAKPFGDAVGEAYTSRNETKGRYPANVLWDGSKAVLDIFPSDRDGSKSRYFYCAKASKKEKNAGLGGLPEKQKIYNGQSGKSSEDMKGVEKKFTTQPTQNAHPCLHPLERIITRDGIKVITEIDRNDFVLTENGTYESVEYVSRHEVSTKMVNINTSGTNITCNATHNHPFLIYEPIKKGNSIVGHNIMWKDAADIKVGDYTMTPITKPQYDVGDPNDLDYWWLAGLWLAEGSITKAGHGYNQYPVWTINKKEVCEIESRIKDKITVYEKESPNAVTVYYGNSKWGSEFERLFGKGAKNKKLSSDIFQLPFDARKSLLEGYIYGDGCMTRKYRAIKTVSEDLAHQIRLLGESVGYFCALYKFIDNKTKKIGDREIKGCGYYYQVFFYEREHQRKPTTATHKDNLYALQRVKEVNISDYEGEVINLSVKNSPTFLTSVGISHNTVKPVALMRHLVQIITPKGGVMLDPFAGSGTTGVAAAELGFNSILIEREAEYIPIIQARINYVYTSGTPRKSAHLTNLKA